MTQGTNYGTTRPHRTEIIEAWATNSTPAPMNNRATQQNPMHPHLFRNRSSRNNQKRLRPVHQGRVANCPSARIRTPPISPSRCLFMLRPRLQCFPDDRHAVVLPFHQGLLESLGLFRRPFAERNAEHHENHATKGRDAQDVEQESHGNDHLLFFCTGQVVQSGVITLRSMGCLRAKNTVQSRFSGSTGWETLMTTQATTQTT